MIYWRTDTSMTLLTFSLLYCKKQINSMLLFLCSVMDHRRCQNVVRMHTFLFLPHFDVICDLLLNRCTAKWNLVSYDPRSYERNLCNRVEKPEKLRTSTGFKPRLIPYPQFNIWFISYIISSKWNLFVTFTVIHAFMFAVMYDICIQRV